MDRSKYTIISLLVAIQVLLAGSKVDACRVGSEKLTNYVTSRIERLLEPTTLSLLYWNDEPLDAKVLGKAMGLNMTIAETKFDIDDMQARKTNNTKNEPSLIEDIFIACSADRGRQNVVAVNLELANPFKRIQIHYIPDGSINPIKFYLNLQQSSYLAQLTQQLGYEECIHINYVQLTSNVEYVIECDECDDNNQKQLDRMFKKRVSHLDAELCSLLSDKMMYGLRSLLDQERLELEMNV